MLTIPRDRQTIDQLQELLASILGARNELYAAADRLADVDQGFICRWIGERLGGHAADLEQAVIASGMPLGERPLEGTANQSCTSADNDRSVLRIAERVEQRLTKEYDIAIEQVPDQEVAGLLRRQRAETEFADCVLRSLRGQGSGGDAQAGR